MKTDSSRILIVDDELDIREGYAHQLEASGYSVEMAISGKKAVELLESKNYDLVISDLQMPELNGIGLLKWIRNKKPDQKVLLISAFADLFNIKDLPSRQWDAFLDKPVRTNLLLKTVQSLLEHSDTADLNEKEYARVPIHSFLSSKPITAPVYIQLAGKRFLKIANSGVEIDSDRISVLQARGVAELWVTSADFANYSALANQIASLAAAPNSKVEKSKKLWLKNVACQIAFEKMRVLGFSEEAINASADSLESAIASLGNDPNITLLMNNIMDGPIPINTHASMVALTCAMIAKVMKWSSSKNIFALSLSGYFSNVGLYELPLKLQIPIPRGLTEDEMKLYKTHPTLCVARLKTCKSISAETLTVILQHHENIEGTGYPNGLLKNEIFPLTRIVSTVEDFVNFCFEDVNNKKPNKIEAILFFMETNKLGYYDRTALIALRAGSISKDLVSASKEFEKLIVR